MNDLVRASNSSDYYRFVIFPNLSVWESWIYGFSTSRCRLYALERPVRDLVSTDRRSSIGYYPPLQKNTFLLGVSRCVHSPPKFADWATQKSNDPFSVVTLSSTTVFLVRIPAVAAMFVSPCVPMPDRPFTYFIYRRDGRPFSHSQFYRNSKHETTERVRCPVWRPPDGSWWKLIPQKKKTTRTRNEKQNRNTQMASDEVWMGFIFTFYCRVCLSYKLTSSFRTQFGRYKC